MTRFSLTSTAAALLLAGSAVAAHAQMPTDNDTWKARCSSLASVASDLNHLPASAAALTRGVAGSKFQTFAFDRQAATQHHVACAMFYLAAIADKVARDDSSARDMALMAGLEVKATHNQEPSFTEGLTRTKVKAVEITHPALTLADEEKIVLAATTVPFTTASASARPVVFQTSVRPGLKR